MAQWSGASAAAAPTAAGSQSPAAAAGAAARRVVQCQWRGLAALTSDDGVHSETLAFTALVVLMVGDSAKAHGSLECEA
jgi:hypothetical protein